MGPGETRSHLRVRVVSACACPPLLNLRPHATRARKPSAAPQRLSSLGQWHGTKYELTTPLFISLHLPSPRQPSRTCSTPLSRYTIRSFRLSFEIAMSTYGSRVLPRRSFLKVAVVLVVIGYALFWTSSLSGRRKGATGYGWTPSATHETNIPGLPNGHLNLTPDCDPSSDRTCTPHTSFSSKAVQFWASFSQALIDARPTVHEIVQTHAMPTDEELHFDRNNGTKQRVDFLEMAPKDLEKMRDAHASIKNEALRLAPLLDYERGTRGIVTTAGGPYIPIFLVSLRMLRRTGSTLPVEVFLAGPEEYNTTYCDDILPKLNAKCVILSDILSTSPSVSKIEKYQFKIFSMLFSSFEDVLFLDADNFPVRSPDKLFTSEPYTSHGLVTWPDFWASTASRLFYDMASQPVPPVNLRQSTESGQVLLSKKTHASALLLATYYNYYGPGYYYPLLSQKAPGEGDKETFLAGAIGVNTTFYAVKEPVSVVGYFDSSFHGVAMVQFDPSVDYKIEQNSTAVQSGDEDLKPARLFIHHNFPKLDPKTIIEKAGQDAQGNKHRMWGTKDDMHRMFGEDLEKIMWEELMITGCELDVETCEKVKKHWVAVYEKGS